MLRRITSVAALLFAVPCLLGLGPAGPRDRERPASAVKAAFLFHAPKFVKWPEEALGEGSDAFNLCTLGQHELAEDLDRIGGKVVKDRKIVIREVKGARKSVDGCHILFVGASESERVQDVLDLVSDRPVLTVSDMTSFDEKGGMIGLFIRDQHIRFRINREAAAVSGLRLSAQLLELAESTPDAGDGKAD